MNALNIKLWKQKAKNLKSEVLALYYAYKDQRVPWFARVFTLLVVGYALSPIDLIPDFIPILGYLDDLLLIPLGVAIAIRMIPAPVMEEARAKAKALTSKPRYWVAALIIVILWMLVLVWFFFNNALLKKSIC